ncbi:MAG: IclR family transcriptional regulator [candidate division NC10 bacterium]|nr:IclR family transcriptional regulator [candidate division NC10 bacterium]
MAQSLPVSRNKTGFESPTSRYAVKAVDKALRILETIGKDSVELNLIELSRHLHIEKSTLHRLLGTLEGRGFIRKDPASLRYSLGIKMLELGTAVTARSALGRTATPVLDRLAVRCRHTVNLAILDRDEVLYVARRDSPEPLRLTVDVGRRIPAHCTALGKAMLAFRPVAEVRRLFSRRRRLPRFTPNTIASPRDLLAQLEAVRRTGVALDREELTLGIRCLAAPVLDLTEFACAAISITAPSATLNEERVAELRPVLLEAVREVSKALGGPSIPPRLRG